MSRANGTPDFNLFRAIEVFMAVAEMRQVTTAAHALGITQSAASQHIRNLETAYGINLFDRSIRPIGLTHAGQMMQRHGFRILNEFEDLRSDMRHMKSSAIPVLRMGMLASIATTLTPGLFDYVEQTLNIPELILSAGLATDHNNALNTRAIDIAVTSEVYVNQDDYDVIPILDEPFFIVLPDSYEGSCIDIDEISSQLSLVRFSSAAPVGRRTDQHLQRCRLNFPRTMEADRSSMVVAGVATGKCFAILSPSLLIDAVAEGMPLRIAPLPFAGFKRTIHLVSRRGDLGAIPAALAQQCAQILQTHFARRFADLAHEVIYHDI